MARDEDWLLQEIARSQSPFQSFERPDSPFSTQGDPGADEVYGTSDILRMAEARKPNAFQRGARWLLDKLPHFGETAPRQSIHEALANPKPVGFAERLADAPARLGNLAVGIPHAVLNSADKYAGGFDAALQGRHAGGGFAGTGVDAEALLVPPDPRMVMPGMGRVIAKGEASPFSSWDALRARIENTPPVPFFGKVKESPVWASETVMEQPGGAWPHQANPFSEHGQILQRRLEGHYSPMAWPRPPKWEGDGTPASVGNMKRLPGPPANDADIGLVKFNAETGNKVPGIVVGEGLRPQKKGSDQHLGFGPSLGAHTDVRTNFPEADFWITRRGSADKLGSVSTEFNPESFGVLNRNHTIDPQYLRYALEHIYNQGWYKGRGHGTTNLQNIRLEDVRSIPIQSSPFRLFSETQNKAGAAVAGKRSEPLPMTAAVAEWIRQATGKEPIVQAAKGHHETDYVKLPDRPEGQPFTTFRVPSDGHPAPPKDGLIDTAAGEGKYSGSTYNRFNEAGQPFSKPEALIDALKWATSSSPEGNWLVPPGSAPRWARYAREEKPASPFTGTEPPSPAQPRLSESVGELWAKTDNKAGALTGREQALRRGQEAYDRGGKLSPWEADAWGDTTANKVDQGRLMDYQRARNEFEDLRPPVGAERLYPEGSGITDRRWVAPGKLNAKSGNRFTAAIAAMRLDPEKAAQAAKALEHLDGVSVAGQVKVLEQYGIPAQLSGPALMKHAPGNRKFSTENRTVTGLEKAVAGFPQEGPPRNFPARYTWAHADNRAKLAQVIKEMDGRDGYGPSTVFKALEAKHPDLAAATTRQSLQQVMTNRRAELGLSGTGSAQPHRWTSDTASAAGKASNPYPGADAAAAARRGKTTKRVLPSTDMAALERRRELNAQRERSSQESRNAPELEKRGGKPFWDEQGKAAAQAADLEYVQELAKRLKERR